MRKSKITQADKELAKHMQACYKDPYFFVMTVFAWGSEDLKSTGPDEWQKDALRTIKYECEQGAALQDVLQMAFASGHGVGKSTVAAWLIIWFMSTRPGDVKGVVTANTYNQVTQKTWTELSKWHKLAINSHWFRWTKDSFYHVQHPETWRIDALPWSEKNTDAFQGLHAEHVLIIFDEASAIPDSIWEVTEGALTTTGAMWFVFGNPTKNTGRFRECFRKFAHRWITKKIDSRYAKMTNKKLINKWAQDYGEESDFFKVRVRGEFPNASSNQLIGSDIVREAFQRKLRIKDVEDSPVVLGVDVAREGDDSTVLTLRQGLKMLWQKSYREIDLMATARIVSNAIITHAVDGAIVDETGLGAGVVDKLREMGHRNIWGVKFNEKSPEREYFNMRAYMWGKMKDWLKNADIVEDPELETDLTAPDYFYRGDGVQIQLESKRDMKSRGLKSPDRGDSLAITFAVNIQKQNEYKAARTSMCNNIKLY